MSGEQKPTGPDLAQGIDLSDIPDSGMLVGHVGDEGVLLVRNGEDVPFAIGSTCTHYGGPLAEGLVVGDTVRCPWHHACFGLRDGEPQRPPALAPVASWRVEREGGRIVVREKNEAKEPVPTDGGPASVVIVGGGAAGNMAAETLRREGYGGPITMISADASGPYDRPNLSKDYLAGNAPEEWIPLHPPEFYKEKNIELKLGTRVMAIDAAAKRLTLEGGETPAYGALLLATGAEPIRLPIAGADLPHVHYLRTLRDSGAIIEAAKTAKHAVVMGASFIGLEVAASLRTRGLAVDVVAPEELPLARIMGEELGRFIRDLHQEQGVVFHLQQTADAIDANGVTLKDGTRLEADLVVIGAGVRPSVALAEAAGLKVDRGVVVDEQLATSAPGIWAAGDIASWPDPHSGERMRVEHWVVAERQGQTAGRNIFGRGERFDAVPFFWSAHYDVTIAYVGHATRWDRIEVRGSFADRNVVAAFHDGDRVAAVATIFRDDISLGAEEAMERDDHDAVRRLIATA
jgi:NADPH-dependent 2,4-dienoyl-CoA reductase/sulfur reductase-like enzyme/nitrite reductase/ring-hydroxylating ferredoxin subunit